MQPRRQNALSLPPHSLLFSSGIFSRRNSLPVSSLVSMAMAATVHSVFASIPQIKSARTKALTRRHSQLNSVSCCQGIAEQNQRVTLRKGNDSLDICRVLNGMWQTSGGWGQMDRDDAVEAMLRYADAGLSTFDMADICKYSSFISFFFFLILFLICVEKFHWAVTNLSDGLLHKYS